MGNQYTYRHEQVRTSTGWVEVCTDWIPFAKCWETVVFHCDEFREIDDAETLDEDRGDDPDELHTSMVQKWKGWPE